MNRRMALLTMFVTPLLAWLGGGPQGATPPRAADSFRIFIPIIDPDGSRHYIPLAERD